ncbi:MAG: hypothetical protein RR599_02465 [Victivallaceae bacterium]
MCCFPCCSITGSTESKSCLGIRDPLSRTRQVLNILGIVAGIVLFILSGALALFCLPLHPVLLAFIAVTGTAFFIAGLVAMRARQHLLSITLPIPEDLVRAS